MAADKVSLNSDTAENTESPEGDYDTTGYPAANDRAMWQKTQNPRKGITTLCVGCGNSGHADTMAENTESPEGDYDAPRMRYQPQQRRPAENTESPEGDYDENYLPPWRRPAARQKTQNPRKGITTLPKTA